MAAPAGTVYVDFAAETAKFTAELKKVQGSLKRLETDFTSLAKVGGVAARLFTGGVFVNLARSAFEAADATADAAARAGIAVESFSRLQYVAKMTDSDIGTLTTGITRLQVTMSKAAEGNKQAQETLALFNISVKELQGLSVEDQLSVIAEQFAKIQNPADRTRAAVELFGKSAGPQLVPLLAQGKKGLADLITEVNKLGGVMTSEGAAAIDQADAAVKRLTTSLEGFKTKFIAGLSILILGPPEESARINEEMIRLQARRDKLMSGGLGKGAAASEVGRKAAQAEIERLNTEIAALGVKYMKVIDETGLANAAAAKAAAAASVAVAEIPSQVFEIAMDQLGKEVQTIQQLDAAYTKAVDNMMAQAARIREENANAQIADDFLASQKKVEKEVSSETNKGLEERSALSDYYADLETRKQKDMLDERKALQEGVFDAGIDALQAFSGQSEKAAKTLVAINKAQAIAQAIQNTAVAVTKAYSQGGVYGVAMAAGIAALGAVQVALIAKSAYGQMSTIKAHGGAPIGTPANPVITQPQAGPGEEGESGQRVVQVVINGNFFGNRETVDYLMESIREEVNTKDVVLFSPASRQAQEIRGQ